MTIEQTVEITDSRKITFDVPKEVPAGRARVIIQFPVRDNKPISRFFGILSPDTYGDGVAYQRAMRDEWDD